MEELKIEGNFKESIWIKIKLNGKDRMLIGCMYKSPSSEASNLKSLNEMIMQATKTKEFSHQLIMGDFNFLKVNWKYGQVMETKMERIAWNVLGTVTYTSILWSLLEIGKIVNPVL